MEDHECQECGLTIGEGEYEENNGVCDMCFEEFGEVYDD
ncbi:hypothetical protein PQD76_gp88 [Stenotrophomonas phage BUCT626]|uniref:Uncharacterized protein n=1 Tax=Stenotrophomonas phage BUCT626 TaxID=2860376 RepID=A0AC61NGN8_9CAUD|nr:hypothetical protein PQD76_gp88 [Stenotrophomonas phage BUCT626]QYC96785.1 hypothetical protein [Stenotrophomonas phage BUCT626]